MRAEAVATIKRWREDPDGAIQFVRSQFQVEPDPDQVAALLGYQKGNATAMAASKGCGKTAVLAWCGWHFMTCYEDSNCAATSITEDNLRDGLWKEFAKWQAKSKLLTREFQWTKERIFAKHPAHTATWWISARTWSKSADAQRQSDTLAGLHADYLLFLLDETGSMPRAVMATAEAALSSGKVAKIVQGGNTTNPDGPLYGACVTHRSLWNVIRMTGDPDSPKRSPRVQVEWAREQIQKYGRHSPWVRVNVLGEFPEAAFNALLSVEEVHAAMSRHLQIHEYHWSQKRLGVDVSRFGDDPTILFPRQGLAAFLPVMMMHERGSPVSVNIASRVLAGKRKWGSEMEFLDSTGGWAAGTRDILMTAGVTPFDVFYSAPAPDPSYANVRAYIWMKGAEWVKRGGALPSVPDLVGEMITPQYTFVNGKFQIEPKDLVKQRLGRSPNYADALFNTFALPDQPASNCGIGLMIGRQQNNKALSEFDPYRDVTEEEERAARRF